MDFIGNKQKIYLLKKILEKGSFAQAYLFSGPESVGKFNLARAFSKGIINDGNLDFSDSHHIDVLILSPEKEEKRNIIREKEIPIEKVRFFLKDLSLYPQKGKRKVLVIRNAHKLTKSAQNALLKNLEEPNSTSIIILVTHEESSILPTIKSRCNVLRFNLTSNEEMEENFGSEISNISMGRPGIAKVISGDRNEKKKHEEIFHNIEKLSQLDEVDKMEFAERISKDKTLSIKFLNIWIWKIRNKAIEYNNIEEGFEKIEKIEKSLRLLKSTNVNSRLLLENLLINI